VNAYTAAARPRMHTGPAVAFSFKSPKRTDRVLRFSPCNPPLRGSAVARRHGYARSLFIESRP